jgi:hypothetical protein
MLAAELSQFDVLMVVALVLFVVAAVVAVLDKAFWAALIASGLGCMVLAFLLQ